MLANVWAVTTNKGGVLKTSLTTNIAGLISKTEKRVLIVDMDNQANVSLAFGQNPDLSKSSIYEVLVKGEDPKNAIINVAPNIYVLPSNDDMAFFELDVLSDRVKYSSPFSLLKNAIDSLKDDFDYILIDCPPNIGLVTGVVMSAADQILIPFQPDLFSMRSLLKTIRVIEDFKNKQNPKLSILGVVATLVDKRTKLHAQVLQECRHFCSERGLRMFQSVIPRSIRFASSVAFDRLPATLVEPNRSLVSNYMRLWKEIEAVGSQK